MLKEGGVPDSSVDSYVQDVLQSTQIVMDEYLKTHSDTFDVKDSMVKFSQDLIINFILCQTK